MKTADAARSTPLGDGSPEAAGAAASEATAAALREFVEEMALTLEAEGLPRMAGRIFTFLLICQPPEQTAADLGRELHASVGSISTMTRLLAGSGLVERVSRAGQRADRFRVTPEGISSLMAAGTYRVSRYRRLLARGLGYLADRPADERARAQQLHDLYAFFETRLPALVQEWQDQRTKEQP